jgi:hypothetical protein
MIILVTPNRVKGTAKRLRGVLRELGYDGRLLKCLELSAKLYGFQNWNHYLRHDLDAPLSPLDCFLSDADFAARDDFQLQVLADAGYAAIARDLLDRVNPTGSWAKTLHDHSADETLPASTI